MVKSILAMKFTPVLIACVLTVAACNKPENTLNTNPSSQLLAVMDAETTGSPRTIHDARLAVSPGDTVTVTGWVMGNAQPFVNDRCVFVLGDPDIITPCNLRPDSPCKTPWDTCCDEPDDIRLATAIIHVVDAEGQILNEGIEGVRGVDKLAKLKVTGSITKSASPNNLIINATAIDVIP